MSAIKVIRRPSQDDFDTTEINRLRREWTQAHRQVDDGPLGGACSFSGCRTMPFVSFRTPEGRRALCLNHFEKLNVEAV